MCTNLLLRQSQWNSTARSSRYRRWWFPVRGKYWPRSVSYHSQPGNQPNFPLNLPSLYFSSFHIRFCWIVWTSIFEPMDVRESMPRQQWQRPMVVTMWNTAWQFQRLCQWHWAACRTPLRSNWMEWRRWQAKLDGQYSERHAKPGASLLSS